MQTIVLYPQNKKQLMALKAVAKALDIKFELGNDLYNSVFVAEVHKGEQARKGGKKGPRVNVGSLWNSEK